LVIWYGVKDDISNEREFAFKASEEPPVGERGSKSGSKKRLVSMFSWLEVFL
jgi:hypothetical protein